MAGRDVLKETSEASAQLSRLSRRSLLRGGVGAVGGAAVLGAVPAAAGGCPFGHGATAAAAPRTSGADHVFSRMFPLKPFAKPTDAVVQALIDFSKPGGVLDAKDDLSVGPIRLITEPTLSPRNRDNPTMTAGVTFFAQFIDHDITYDSTSALGVPTDLEDIPNARAARLDLDSVYGLGPVLDQHLYAADHCRLRVESGGRFEDVPRREDGAPLIADHRNDSNLLISGLHAAFLCLHNKVVDHLAQTGFSSDSSDLFEEARRLVRWHYQWLVVNEILPLLCGQGAVSAALRKRRWYRDERAGSMPVEFAGAVYRFGHSMVRPSYRANLKGNPGDKPFFAFFLDPTSPPEGYGYGADPEEFAGGYRAERRFVGWQTFFDFGDGLVRPNKRIDASLSTPMFHLPFSAIATFDRPFVLPQRTLLRALTYGLPSGQDVAKAMGAPVLSPADLSEWAGYGLKLERSTPLWHYVLKEAELQTDGLHLGPVGAQVVAEVIIGLLMGDSTSYLGAAPKWRPSLPQRDGRVTGEFQVIDMLTFAGVDPASRGQ